MTPAHLCRHVLTVGRQTWIWAPIAGQFHYRDDKACGTPSKLARSPAGVAPLLIAGGYSVFGLLCALAFQADQVPAVVTKGWTGGQCCLAPTIYTFSA